VVAGVPARRLRLGIQTRPGGQGRPPPRDLQSCILRFVRISCTGRVGQMSWSRCISTLGCPEFSLEEALALAGKHGVTSIEVRALGGTVDLPAYLAATYGSPAALAGRLRGSPVRIVAFNVSLRLAGGTAAEKEQLVAIVPWVEALGVKWVRVFDGGKDATADEFVAARETLRWWEDLRARHRWQAEVMIETHDSLFTAEKISNFLRAVPGIAVLWDAHHTWRKGGEEPVVTWAAIRSSVVHVHVKDSIPVPSARHPFTYVLPGDGGFPIAKTLAALRTDAFAGPVSLEWEKLWHPYLPSLDEALTVARTRSWW
jgi:sugar phosphate isomerase/epimerase